MKSFFILTDLEGPAGVDSFTQTRPSDGFPDRIEAAKNLLAQEVNACIEGIRSVYPDSRIDVWDGHGPGGLHKEDVVGGTYLRDGHPYKYMAGYDALLFVGQHAMAGTFNAPLCHTYSSQTIAYYKLNDVFIGEFGARALIAGHQGVRTVFISGDDKAILEARMFVPEIETAVVKRGTGIEAAVHLATDEACRVIREGSAKAVRRIPEIKPFTAIKPPFVLEMGYLQPMQAGEAPTGPDVEFINDRTIRIYNREIKDLPL
ncbi:M55 family metallopeptidase [Paenibacillus filicis]|uniref:M55 family metallopeptidase n=1 Tax=Paenibacillus gyeongsangnamensis TaxID=3388067 RepID=A0ABT4Q4J7_9BACL|nr:M55 family metallopeptidase [Paenibacillus filicis]MCZ8511731.1 M55 family metallopeptidase [Paenibacillus filicis]